jgi:hypothetical protein
VVATVEVVCPPEKKAGDVMTLGIAGLGEQKQNVRAE